MAKYSHVFFDIDRTLWDFDKNTLLTFNDILHKHELFERGIPSLNSFMEIYSPINRKLWELYKAGEIGKPELNHLRFYSTLLSFGIDDSRCAEQIAMDYIDISPTKTALIEGALEVLDYLKERYHLGLITNGFEEIQRYKVVLSGLQSYFKWVITSEEAGYLKPHAGIFEYALKKTGAPASGSLYIGDEPVADVQGARLAGMDQVLFNRNGIENDTTATYTILHLRELTTLL